MPCDVQAWRGTTADRDDAIAFYRRELGRDVEIAATEELVLEREDSRVVAVARLATEHGVLVLRTMVVADGSRRRGIGSDLLERASNAISGRTCYCIAWSYLEDFYGRAGFRRVAADQLPPHLRERLGDRLIGMRRDARS